MTDGANPGLDLGESIFYDLIWTPLLDAELAAFFVANPGLAAWPVAPIIRGIAKLISDRIFDRAKLTVDLTAITILSDAHRDAYEKASIRLMVIAKDYGPDSPEYRSARDEDLAALSRFVRRTE